MGFYSSAKVAPNLKGIVGAGAVSALGSAIAAAQLPNLNGEGEVALQKVSSADSDSEQRVLKLTKAKNGARAGVAKAAVVRADRGRRAISAASAVASASILSRAKAGASSVSALGLANLKGNIAALGSSIEDNEARAVENLTSNTIGL